MITAKELIKKLQNCDPDAYVATYSSMYEGDTIITNVLPEVHLSKYGVKEYGCNDYSIVGDYMAQNPEAKFVVLRD